MGRPRSGAERDHGAARRFRTERLRGTRTERLRAPPRGAMHGAGTEQLREAARIVPYPGAQARGPELAPPPPGAAVTT